MAVRMKATDLEDDVLPRVCVVTGAPADSTWRVRYVNPAGALWLLLLFGVLPFVLARFLTRHEVEGLLPISAEGIAEVEDRRRHALLSVLVALAAGVLGVGIGFAAESVPLVLGAIALALVVWMVGAFVWADPVSGSVEQSGRWVRLDGEHPAFKVAVVERRAPV